MQGTLLVSAFEPFGGSSQNASQEALLQLAGSSFQGYKLESLLLPVDTVTGPEKALLRLQQAPVDLFVMLGEAAGRTVVTPERVAINVDDYPIPDNAGVQRQGEPIVPGGPVGYFSHFAVGELVAAAASAGHPCSLSNTAGTYLCNRLFYQVMHAIETNGWKTRAGFIHLPTLADNSLAATCATLETMLNHLTGGSIGQL